MRIVLITQNEPFYLNSQIKFLIENLPSEHQIVGCVLAKPSPFGKKHNFFEKVWQTKKIFGSKFFLYYSMRFLISKIFMKSVKKTLIKNNIDIINILGSINSNKNVKLIKSYKPCLLISILGNQIFKDPIINLAKKGCINLHSALLPKYRGLMPTFWVLKNNEKETGVSVFFVDQGIDSGPIIVQEKIKISNMSQSELIKKTKKIGMKLILKAITLINDENFNLIPNPESEKSYYGFPTRKDVEEFYKAGKNFF